ncbi:ORF9 [Chimpanzee stool associated circular ssDNA virus]|nr:ORF9 [Chimpanzee stool associated circular ssDNA virus]
MAYYRRSYRRSYNRRPVRRSYGKKVLPQVIRMFVKVSETYDLSTQTDKMGFVGIHTPEGKLVYNMWSGLFKNFRKFRYASCDVTMACASMLPADPLQIGVEAGDIAPQDMFNPILYKAVSMTLCLRCSIGSTSVRLVLPPQSR